LKVRDFFAQREAAKWEEKDIGISRAIIHNTRWWKPMMIPGRQGWQKNIREKLDSLSANSKRFIQKLNDQHVSPSGDIGITDQSDN